MFGSLSTWLRNGEVARRDTTWGRSMAANHKLVLFKSDALDADMIQVLVPLVAFERDPSTRLALWRLVGALIDKVPRGAAQIDIFQDVSVSRLGRQADGGRRKA